MFGQSYLVSKAVKFIAKQCDLSDEDAKGLAVVAGITTAFITLDPKGGALTAWSADELGEETVKELRRKWLEDL